jgi:aminoglycoside phosphotransferase (APT) family kinase protein
MTKDYYIQPDALDPVLSESAVMELVRRHLPEANTVTGVDENGGEARTYAIDEHWILKIQRPQQLRPKTSLEKESFFLDYLKTISDVCVPKVLGRGKEGKYIDYTLMTRMPGIAIEYATLNGDKREQALSDLGSMLRKIHGLPQSPFMDSRLFPGDHSPVDVRWRFGNLFDDVVEMINKSPKSWSYPIDPIKVSRLAMHELPDVDMWTVLHSNPGPEHVFVHPENGLLSGIIDFGDAYFSHPAHDLRRFRSPQDRNAVFAGYCSGAPVSENFIQTWRVAQILTDMIAIVRNPEFCEAAKEELDQILNEFQEKENFK